MELDRLGIVGLVRQTRREPLDLAVATCRRAHTKLQHGGAWNFADTETEYVPIPCR